MFPTPNLVDMATIHRHVRKNNIHVCFFASNAVTNLQIILSAACILLVVDLKHR